MPLRDPATIGEDIGKFCITFIQKFIPHLTFETEQEIHRFCFGAGIVILTLAKDNAAGFAASAGPQFVRAICDAIEKPFVTMIKGLDISIAYSEVASFLPDESEQELFCRWSNTPKDELAASDTSTDLSIFLSLVYANRERLYYGDLRAAADIPESVFTAVGVMVFVYKRFMLHVYGIKTDMRSLLLEDELTAKSITPGVIFSRAYKALYDYIEPLLADDPNT